MMPGSSPTTNSPASLLQSINPLNQLKQQKADAELLHWAKSAFRRAKEDRGPTENQWYINAAFYFGKQNVVSIASRASTGGAQLTTPKAPPWRVRMVINKIRPIVRHEVARLTSQKPTFTVVPATTEDEDYQAARVGEAIFRAVYSDKNVSRELRRAIWWTVITGTGFVKCYWDPYKTDQNSQQLGDFCIERVSPFFIFVPDLEVEDLEEQPWVMHASTKSVEYVKTRWGIDAAADSKSADLLEDSFLNLIGAQQQKKDSVLCLEVWLKPGSHPQFPGGGMFTVVGDKIMRQADSYPYKHGMFPFQKLDYIQSGKFYGESTITDLIPIQREYNRTHSQIIEAKNIMAKPRLVAPRGSVNPRQITSEPGQVVLYTPGYDRPSPLPMDSLPPYVMEELSRLTQDFDDISAQHEISRGGTPSQVTAATAISYLQEQDDSKLSATIASIEEGIEKLGRQILTYVVQFWTTERVVRSVGLDGAFEAAHWQANDLRGNVDLRVEAGSALPQSKAAKQAFVMDLIKMQIVAPEVALELLDIGGVEKIYEDFLTDKRQVQRENLKMASIKDDPAAMQQLTPQPVVDPASGMPAIDPASGQPVLQPPPLLIQPNTYDNHQVHIALHNQFRKSQTFELLPQPIKDQFEQHVMLHQYALMGGVQPQNGIPGQPVGGPAMIDPAQQQQQQDPAQQQQPAGPPQQQQQ